MSVSLLPILTQAAQEGPSEGDIVGAVWLGMVILFLVSVFVTGFTAKKIENLHHPTYVKAFVAQFLIRHRLHVHPHRPLQDRVRLELG
jgi:hypothetical protein